MVLVRTILVCLAVLCAANCNAEEFEISQLTHLMGKGIDEVTEFMKVNSYELNRDIALVGGIQTIRYVPVAGDNRVKLDTFFRNGLLFSLEYFFTSPKTSRRNSKWLNKSENYFLHAKGETTFHRNWTFMRDGSEFAIYQRIRKSLSEFEDFDSRSRFPDKEAKFKISFSSETGNHKKGRMYRFRKMSGDACCEIVN